MTTSGTTTFDLEVSDIIEEAYQLIGMNDIRTADQAKSARRSLDLVLQELESEGVNLWRIERRTLTLTPSTPSYALTADIVDILDASIRDSSGTDITLDRLGIQQFLEIPDKTTESRPTHFMLRRSIPTPTLEVWPVPDATQTYTFVYEVIARIQDVGNSSRTLQVPHYFLPAITVGLAFQLALKNTAAGGELMANQARALGARYQQLLKLAREENRERSDFIITPFVPRLRG